MSKKNNPNSFSDLLPHEIVDLVRNTAIAARDACPERVQVAQRDNQIAIILHLPSVANSSGK